MQSQEGKQPKSVLNQVLPKRFVVASFIGAAVFVALLVIGKNNPDGFLGSLVASRLGTYGIIFFSFLGTYAVAHLLGFKMLVKPEGSSDEGPA